MKKFYFQRLSFSYFTSKLYLAMTVLILSYSTCDACNNNISPPLALDSKTTCPICKTTGLAADQWLAQIVYPDFTLYAFDSHNCLFNYVFKPDTIMSIAAFWVRDSVSGEWIYGNSTHFTIVKPENNTSVPKILSFKKSEDAKNYADKHGGISHYFTKITEEMTTEM